MVQIKAKRLKGNNQGLYDFRLGLTREQVIELFNFIGWMIQLPEALENRFFEAIKVVEEEMKMPYINVIERHGIRQGLKQGLEQGRLEAEKNFEQEYLEAEQEKRETVRQLLAIGALTLTDEQIAETIKL